MIILRVGDPHIRPSNIEESNKLMSFVQKIIVESMSVEPINRLEILGDLMHTHAVVRVEVLDFWHKWLQTFSSLVETVVLVGNHDQTGDKHNSSHSLNTLKTLMRTEKNLKIVDSPYLSGVFGYMPYVHENDQFIAKANSLVEEGAKIIVCHATFDGSQYDNGFYAPNGIDPALIKADHIISGHVHKEQIIANGKVDYPGTPKWDTSSDANENKGVWRYKHDINGKVLERLLIPTDKVVTPIVSFTWTEGQEAPSIPEGAKANVELIGSSDWIKKQKALLKGKVSISTKFTDKKRTLNRKAGNSFENYLNSLYSSKIDKDSLIKYAKEIGIV